MSSILASSPDRRPAESPAGAAPASTPEPAALAASPRWLLPALLVLAFAVRFVGLGHEVEGRYYLDEGTYYHHATKILDGEVWSPTFVYPHLVYYLDAAALWVASLAPGLVARLAAALYGVEDPLAVSWLLLRGVVAALSALTTVPVFFLGRRLGGTTAGATGALLLVFSDTFNEGSHLNTCDVPSAFFATVCLVFVGRLLDEERWQDYAWAGVAAGLAAGSKYPAGVVAVAIVAVWVRWRIAGWRGVSPSAVRRRFPPGIAVAGAAAIAAFVAATPSLLVFPRLAFLGDRGMLFGARQYGAGGWIGVMPRSNALFYGQLVAAGFGLLALVLGIAGLVLLSPRQRKRVLWLLPFPVLYLALIASMNMAVRRNLYPAIPILAVLLGLGIAAVVGRLRSRLATARLRAVATAAVLLLAVGPAAARTVEQEISLASPSTRDEARAWIRAHLPHGVKIVKESYTPSFPPEEFAVQQGRFAGRLTVAELRDAQNDYLLLASAAYNRFQNPAAVTKAHQRAIGANYRAIFSTLPLVREWSPERRQLGPTLRLYRLEPPPSACTAGGTLEAESAFVPDGGMRPAPQDPVRFFAEGQWALLKGCFSPGSYRVEVDGAWSGAGELRLRALDGRDVAKAALSPGASPAALFSLQREEKVLLVLWLPPGSELRRLHVRPT